MMSDGGSVSPQALDGPDTEYMVTGEEQRLTFLSSRFGVEVSRLGEETLHRGAKNNKGGTFVKLRRRLDANEKSRAKGDIAAKTGEAAIVCRIR
ncbi:hypothetical protein Ddc_07884 [Ditylenchus destructor]|nr:hypothetical protein Ddc_07884 [Ditylenchus destructor]